MYTQCMSTTDAPYKCRELRDDYLECLHHRKEVCKQKFLYVQCGVGLWTCSIDIDVMSVHCSSQD